jgi:hypothetical protein
MPLFPQLRNEGLKLRVIDRSSNILDNFSGEKVIYKKNEKLLSFK